MNRFPSSFLNPISLGLMVALFLSSACQSGSSTTKTPSGPFSPSHAEGMDLIERTDGDFDTPVDLTYKDPDGKVWTAPKGTITDGASIPNVFTGFFGGKLNEKHLFAAIVHDAYCGRANEGKDSYQIESWQDTHRMFYHACISNGRSKTKASTMYAAVRLGGPRWAFNGESFTDLSGVNPDSLMKELQYCEAWIASKGEDLTLEEIDQWMEYRERGLVEGNLDYSQQFEQ